MPAVGYKDDEGGTGWGDRDCAAVFWVGSKGEKFMEMIINQVIFLNI